MYRFDSAGALTTLHAFNGLDGQGPGAIVFARGTLFGNTVGGGSNNYGALFSMKTDGSDFVLLHSFNGKDGYQPSGNVLPVKNGGMFGIAFYGGDAFSSTNSNPGKGVLFFLASDGSMHVLHGFEGGSDGQSPNTLVMDSSGNVFGTAEYGGGCDYGRGCGLVFEYSPSTRTYSTIYTFTDSNVDGFTPKLGAAGPDGTLYGVASGGSKGTGTLFSLTPGAKAYTFTLLANLPNLGTASTPTNAPSLTKDGELVGETGTAVYGYTNGKISVLGRVGSPPLLPITYAPFLIGPRATLYGTSPSGPQPCTLVGGNYYDPGCGYIFSYQLH